ncbi:MAG TPA: XRE family transcriptional regulator [Hungateiclostridium thermocellum]|uniref:Helix-turn-helix domain protein n=1 Tax=Acetivibrio thermocellus (strain ATCC 27405 / DSM 1237 / JCM 9322 / NBRC 103400 / NCIMB 10682 / NRRL B-4536 / VPI 7372) TaxID=203119 RepID=A3DI83_ACET2|nr:helix-turn-helix transcriptional regulator [Acetivibrio thermocellus]ABN53662.1 helix-turn-helix domain protein [Acetivibrio thermocellus ATCC 27405]HBW27860.1 XRE family transcriptional regulator [Acetivibrio thermocellus]
MPFNEILRQLRTEKNLSQKDVADAIGVDRTTYTKYETGKSQPDFVTIQKLAEFYSVSVDYLLGRTDIRNPYIPEEYTQKHKVTKRDLMQYEDFIKQAGIFFMNDEVAEEDKEKLFRDISELFWKAKEMNKKKYGRKKAKTDQ